MDQIINFNGEIIGKNDLDFLNQGTRKSIVKFANILSGSGGGIISGLQVLKSIDNLSILINPGKFISAGNFNEKNAVGGGELGELFTQQNFTLLPETAPLSNLPTFLLVYAKIVSSNVDPNILNSQNIITSRNLQTGENVPTRQYNKAVIVVTNPLLLSTALTITGVPLALIQVNYNGTQKISSDGSIQSLDNSIAKNFVVGGSVDVNKQTIIDAGIPNNFLTTRMFLDNQITGQKFQDNSIGSQKIAQWDTTTAYNNLTGSGVANQHIKDGAITQSKINYSLGLNNFNDRNRVMNGSFEILSGVSTLPLNWNINNDLGTTVIVTPFAIDPTAPKFGDKAIFLEGGESGIPTALNVQISQIINFEGNLTSLPISAFFWARQVSITNFAISGTTGLQATIQFLDNGNNVLQSQSFGLVSGVSNSNYNEYTTSSPVIYTGTTKSTSIKYIIGGNFNGSYYIDGVSLTQSSLIPGFDSNPSEYVAVAGLNTNLLIGQITSSQITNGAITTNKILNVDGTTSSDTGNGIIASQIRPNIINGGSGGPIIDGSITQAKFAPGVAIVPSNALIMWDASNTCPTGYIEATEYAGLFPIGRNSAVGSTINSAGQVGGTAANSANTTSSIEASHIHDAANNITGSIQRSPSNGSTTGPGTGHNHIIPFKVVLLCRKT